MQPAAAQSFILEAMIHGLPSSLTYHNIGHTERAMEHAALLAESEGVTEYELDLIITAAAYHDSGFLQNYSGHEETSCELARQYLPQFEFSMTEIDSICEIIMATRLPQTPKNKLSSILCDADLYYLGTDDYTTVAEHLYQEFILEDIVKDKMEWQRQQVDFLKSHRYFTPTARKTLADKQDKNLIVLQSRTESPHTIKHHESTFSDVVLIIFGVLITSFALQSFLIPNDFFDGGITGISLLINHIYHINLAYVIVLANIPFIVMSYISINKGFAIKTFFCVLFLGICLLVPNFFPIITNNQLLVSVFGGFFLGLGIGLTMRAGCAVDGIEVLALYTLRRSSFTVSEIILGLNIVIFMVAAIRYGYDTALFSMLTYFTASQTIDYVIEGANAFTGVTIISAKSDQIKHKLVNELGRGITVYKGERGYLPGKFDVHDDCDIIFTIISRLEMRKLKNMVIEVDPNAFVFASTIKETSGGILRKKHVH